MEQKAQTEIPDLNLEDGAVRIFLNTRGENRDEVSKELVDFLHYVEKTTDSTAEKTESARIRRIHERVCKVRASEEIGVKYMQEWEERYYDKLEAQEEGRKEEKERINELNRRLLKDDRLEDLKRTILDTEFQQKMLEEYGL